MPTINLHRRRVLLATIVPLLLKQHRTPIITSPDSVTPQFSDSTPNKPTNNLAFNTLAMMSASVHCSLPEVVPYPEQGGKQITLEYLELISEAECIWRFQ